MKRVILIPVAAAGALAAALALYLHEPAAERARREGEAEAERDIQAGSLKLKTCGYPAPWASEWARLLEDRLGVEEECVAGCCVTEELVANIRGYDGRMEREIKRRFGNTALYDIAAEAQARHEDAGEKKEAR
jgi:hypothetical protein